MQINEINTIWNLNVMCTAQRESVKLHQIHRKLRHLRTVSLCPWESQKSNWGPRCSTQPLINFVSSREKGIINSQLSIQGDVLLFLLQGHLLYNEYIVYNVDQIRMRYVVQVNFKYQSLV